MGIDVAFIVAGVFLAASGWLAHLRARSRQRGAGYWPLGLCTLGFTFIVLASLGLLLGF